jgi:hypothetical protein
MLRATALSALLLAATTDSVLASDVSDPSGRFTATIPDGWTAVDSLPPPAVFMIRKTGADGSRSICTAVIIATPATTSKTQQEIDDEILRVNTNDAVKAAYEQQGFKDVSVEKQSKRQGDGHVVHQVVLTLSVPAASGTAARLKVFEELHALPGQTHDLGCMTKPENYDAMAPEFQAVGLGYQPKSAILAWAGSPAVTLYAEAGFHGQSRGISNDLPDVARSGWAGRTGSLGVTDASSWQVCEKANFTGRCMVLKASLVGQANTHFPVGSLRRLDDTASSSAAQSRKATGLSVMMGAGALLHP